MLLIWFPWPVANNESSKIIDILLPLILTLRPGLIMSKSSDDSLFAGRCCCDRHCQAVEHAEQLRSTDQRYYGTDRMSHFQQLTIHEQLPRARRRPIVIKGLTSADCLFTVHCAVRLVGLQLAYNLISYAYYTHLTSVSGRIFIYLPMHTGVKQLLNAQEAYIYTSGSNVSQVIDTRDECDHYSLTLYWVKRFVEICWKVCPIL